MTPAPTFPRPGYDDDSPAAWLTADEAAMLEAVLCPDITVDITVSVRLKEFRGRRPPKRLTDEQIEREDAASRHMAAYQHALGSIPRFLMLLAAERKAARGAK